MATPGALAPRRTVTALDLKSLLRAAQRDAASVEWPPALIQQLTNAVRERVCGHGQGGRGYEERRECVDTGRGVRGMRRGESVWTRAGG